MEYDLSQSALTMLHDAIIYTPFNLPINNRYQISDIKNEVVYIYDSREKVKVIAPVFFKFAPLANPYNYIVNEHADVSVDIFQLQQYVSITNANEFIYCENSAFTDSFFTYISSTLIDRHNFIHAVNYYGSYIGIKHKYKLDVCEEFEELMESSYFKSNRKTLFTFEDEEYNVMFDNINGSLIPLHIDMDSNIDLELEMDVMPTSTFTVGEEGIQEKVVNEYLPVDTVCAEEPLLIEYADKIKRKSSMCSSRSSNTTENTVSVDTVGAEDTNTDTDTDDDNVWTDEDTIDADDECMLIIDKFPVQTICMEKCENTLEYLMMSGSMDTADQWRSALMQIIMILITYQKVFHFTHNDLHTCNIVYSLTDKEYVTYMFNSKIYKVPTFNKIFKIIDFGRSMYRYNGSLFCSNDFNLIDGPGAEQYNTEPYYNPDKPRVEQNYSFDLCRLGCGLYDEFIDDYSKSMSKIRDLILQWCTTDNGKNILYKKGKENEGKERYSSFKLYKMIARTVHAHTPIAQLSNSLFSSYIISQKSFLKLPANKIIHINIDAMFVLI